MGNNTAKPIVGGSNLSSLLRVAESANEAGVYASDRDS